MKSVETRAMNWLLGDDTGASSKTICAVMMGADETPTLWGWNHPLDPADFGRCARLLAVVPEWRNRLHEMKRCGDAWSALVDRWDEIERSMADEVGIDWSKAKSAPKTYALMKSIVG